MRREERRELIETVESAASNHVNQFRGVEGNLRGLNSTRAVLKGAKEHESLSDVGHGTPETIVSIFVV